jgi:hypothetical protein
MRSASTSIERSRDTCACTSPDLNEDVFKRRVGDTPVSYAHGLACCFHLGKDLLRGDAADGDAAAQGIADQSTGYSACRKRVTIEWGDDGSCKHLARGWIGTAALEGPCRG